ncbi:hypothetical protein ABFS83_03G072200 [Erythranthe nasuta]
MGKKKFIDKKNASKYKIMARDTSDPKYSSGSSRDQILIRVDNNQNVPSVFEEDDPEEDSIFADAPEDCDGDNENEDSNDAVRKHKLPDHIREEILNLGFPDDGYNYLTHLREIKKKGAGTAYYDNPNASFEVLPPDVKAYDASRVEVSKINDAYEEKPIYNVASKTVGVRLKKAVDPEVAALLNDSDSSKFGSDIEDLEEDFVAIANISEGPIAEEINEEKLSSVSDSRIKPSTEMVKPSTETAACFTGFESEKPRTRRPLDEYFDMLELNEYGADSEEEEEYNEFMDVEESITEKLSHALHHNPSNLLHLKRDKDEEEDDEPPELTAEVIRRCKEYGVKYEDEDDDLEDVLVEVSSDESEKWDCETIVTTYSTLDNHPGKIGAPESRRKKKLTEAIFSAAPTGQVITLGGKERIPVDFLPQSRKHSESKVKDVSDKTTELPKPKPRGEETKEEKKERKSAVKLERREARLMKKEMKGLYKSEGHRAQKVAAFTGPSSIHLM